MGKSLHHLKLKSVLINITFRTYRFETNIINLRELFEMMISLVRE